MALVVDQLTGAGLVAQQDSFLGKVALHIVVFAILLVRCGGGGLGGARARPHAHACARRRALSWCSPHVHSHIHNTTT